MRTAVNLFLFTLLWLVTGGPGFSSDRIIADRLVDHEPEDVPQPVTWQFDSSLVDLWRKALRRPESDYQRMACEALIQAYGYGHESVKAAIPDLQAVVLDENIHPSARYAAARALILFDHRESVRILFEASQKHGKDLRQLVEPALAAWNYPDIRSVWRDRISSTQTPRRDLALAIHGLGIERDANAVDGLLKLVMPGNVPADIRLAAARSVGQILHEGNESLTEQLRTRQNASTIDRLCAVSLIGQHRSDQAVQALLQLTADAEPTIASAALKFLYSNDPQLVLAVADSAMQNNDANVRRIGIDSYLKLPSPDRIHRVSRLLNDPHPEHRIMIRDAFYSMAIKSEFKSDVVAATLAILFGDDWRGQEQAALILGAMDQKQISGRLIELIESQRPEVKVASAWALRKLAIPETASSVHAYAERVTATVGTKEMPGHVDRQIAHLFELLGILKDRRSIPLMEKYIPKTTMFGGDARSSAIWSLGVIQEGEMNQALADKLLERVTDVAGIPPELDDVRRTSVLTLTRLGAKKHVRDLKKLVAGGIANVPVDLTIRWAIWKLTGEKLPLPTPPTLVRTGWFLEHSLKVQASPGSDAPQD